MRLPRLDVFSAGRAAVDILVKDRALRVFRLVTMKRVSGPPPDFDARFDPLDAAPAFGAVVELLEAAELGGRILGAASKRALGAGLEALDMPAECRGRRDAQDVLRPFGPAPVKTSGQQ